LPIGQPLDPFGGVIETVSKLFEAAMHSFLCSPPEGLGDPTP
jgi:hypothetical protein